ncbi:hypothetical protein KIN20_016342 [Parelaphostrongylus tenuis]|uniref:Uncharacterized protein n=1 Tax=Parelaphostrongylus tenuis TaxID=148309 RepID=A0AAD5ML91_PARTN|nr:hypothetical protein KIN20_016342 [Parelaphostrongylus tenuis]
MAIRTHYEVFINALSPNPEDDRQHFEQAKEGLGRLLALMPYDVISIETWSRVNAEMASEQQHDLKILLCKIFEPDLCPLPFETAMVFDFVSSRLGGNDYVELFNALQWLHLLSRLEISIPLDMLLENFSIALNGLSAMDIPRQEQNDLEDDDISIHIVIIDILVLQLAKAESPKVTKRRLSPQTLQLIRVESREQQARYVRLAKRVKEATKENLKERRAAAMTESVEVGKDIDSYLYTWTLRLHEMCGPHDIFHSSRLVAIVVHGSGFIRAWPLAQVSYRDRRISAGTDIADANIDMNTAD